MTGLLLRLMLKMNLNLYQSYQYKGLFNSLNKAVLKNEYLKFNQKGTEKNLIRIYLKLEKINRILKEVYYICVYYGTEPTEENLIIFKRTMSLKELSRIKQHIESLK